MIAFWFMLGATCGCHGLDTPQDNSALAMRLWKSFLSARESKMPAAAVFRTGLVRLGQPALLLLLDEYRQADRALRLDILYIIAAFRRQASRAEPMLRDIIMNTPDIEVQRVAVLAWLEARRDRVE